MNCHPQTPQSPSQLSMGLDSFNGMPSGQTLETLPTPAHSVNGGNSQHDYPMDDSIHLKRKRSIEDGGDHASKRLQIDTCNVGIEALHMDVGPKYLLGKKTAPRPKYPATNDFFVTFGLLPLATKLAREKPNGEKNILRKSFKNQLKNLKIEGGYDTKKDSRGSQDPESLPYMLSMPDDYWYANHVKGKDVLDGFSAQTSSALQKATVMARGKVRKEAWDPYILGSLESGPFLGDHSASGSTPNTPGGAMSRVPRVTSGNGSASSLASLVNDPRVRRNIKKRSYNESSFEGYSESFGEEEIVEGGYSTGDGDDRSGQKRRKKNAGSMASASGNVRQAAYGPGIVGV